jgi:hypothetical protein
LTVPSALLIDENSALTSIDGPSTRLPDVNPNLRNDVTDPVHGPGMHMTSGAMLRLRFENVSDPEHPLKLWATVIVVTASAAEIVNTIGIPWAVVPLHWPA